jgi:hypothetical protein
MGQQREKLCRVKALYFWQGAYVSPPITSAHAAKVKAFLLSTLHIFNKDAWFFVMKFWGLFYAYCVFHSRYVGVTQQEWEVLFQFGEHIFFKYVVVFVILHLWSWWSFNASNNYIVNKANQQ